MLILAKLLRQSLWRGTLLSHKDEEELRNAFLHKYPLNNDALDNLLCSFLHFYSSRTGTWSVSLNENDLMKCINNKGKKKLWYLLTLKLSRVRWQEMFHLSYKRWLWLVAKHSVAFLLMSWKGRPCRHFLSQSLGDLLNEGFNCSCANFVTILVKWYMWFCFEGGNNMI